MMIMGSVFSCEKLKPKIRGECYVMLWYNWQRGG